MNIAIVDDDKTAGQLLADKLAHYDGAHLCGIAINGNDGMRLVQKSQPDLLFLDIELPDISGMEFLERIGGICHKPCRVVMYTAHDRYMLSAFRNRAFDYLMKPIDDGDLRSILKRACIEMQNDRLSEPVREAAQPIVEPLSDDGCIAKRNDGKYLFYVNNSADFRLVDIRDIGVFAYNHEMRVWEIVVAGQTDVIRLRRNVSSDMILALNETLIRVSQKHIINLDFLMEVADNICRFFPPFDGLSDVKVGRQYRKKLIDRFCGF